MNLVSEPSVFEPLKFTVFVCRKYEPSSCSKLTMSLVNVLLKLWSLNVDNRLIFLLKKFDLQKLLTFFQQKYL